MDSSREVKGRQLKEQSLSERQACDRWQERRQPALRTSRRRQREAGERLKDLAGQHRRHGYRMLRNRLRIDGWAINVKRSYRVYREEGLMGR